MIKIERLTEPVCSVGESPVWHAGESALYWVDIPAGRILRRHEGTGVIDTWTAGSMVGCIALSRDGALIAGMEDGIYSLALRPGGSVNATRQASPVLPLPGMRFNDGRCDRQGRFWAGTMHTDMAAAHAVGGLYRYTGAEGLVGPVENGLITQNGLAWSPSGDRMYLSDSHPRVQLIWAFDYDVDTGTPHHRRLFVDMNLHPGRPDGAAVDVDGCYWTCANDAGQLLRFTPAGKLDRSIALPVTKPSMCAFGGKNLDTLYVTSIRPQGAAAQMFDGALFALQPGIQGLPETEFGVLKQQGH
ncbi:MAG: SMP-30/gluconolactonase/LRE family protein [Betaproteobacteria bacterium]